MQPPATPPWPQAPRGSSRALPGAHKRAPGHSPGFSHIQAPARGWAGGEALSPPALGLTEQFAPGAVGCWFPPPLPRPRFPTSLVQALPFPHLASNGGGSIGCSCS